MPVARSSSAPGRPTAPRRGPAGGRRTPRRRPAAGRRGVDLDDLGPERGRGRDHRDAGVRAAGALDELAQDGALAELVLGPADDEQVTVAAPVRPWAPNGMTGSLRGGRLAQVSPSSPDSSSGRRVLLVMRHGKAEPFAAEDHLRRLTERGAREAHGAGEWLADQGLVPTHALVSSAVRAQDTWASLAGVTGTRIEPVVDDALYTAGPDTALDLLRARRRTPRWCCTSATTRPPPRSPTCSTTATPTPRRSGDQRRLPDRGHGGARRPRPLGRARPATARSTSTRRPGLVAPAHGAASGRRRQAMQSDAARSHVTRAASHGSRIATGRSDAAVLGRW